MLSTCQGVVLLTDSTFKTYMLWNPLTRAASKFWFPYKRIDTNRLKFGLCHDPESDDFKVVLTSETNYSVYSIKNQSWTKKKRFWYPSCEEGIDGGIFVDGVIYWVAFIEGRECREIIYFDPRDNGFKALDKTEYMKGLLKEEEFFLVCLRGCLCLYFKPMSSHNNIALRIWIKEKGRDNNSWSELMIIENLEPRIQRFTPMCFVENNKILIYVDWKRFVIYCPCKKTFEECEDIRGHCLLNLEFIPYQQSLLFPLRLDNLSRPKRKRSRVG